MADWEHDVAVFEPGSDQTNTLVLSGVDLVVPLERDLDNDPFQDDEVRLRSEDGHFERILLSSDDDVEPSPDGTLLHYCFRCVPPGMYGVSVRVAGEWTSVLRGLVVERGKAFSSARVHPPERSDEAPAPAPELDDRPDEEDDEPFDNQHERFIDEEA